MRLRLGRIERYVLIQQMKSLGVALAVIAALVMLIDFVEVSRGLNSSGELSGGRILGLVMVKSPSVIVQLLPFVFLFGTLGAFVSLNRRSELIAMRAARARMVGCMFTEEGSGAMPPKVGSSLSRSTSNRSGGGLVSRGRM